MTIRVEEFADDLYPWSPTVDCEAVIECWGGGAGGANAGMFPGNGGGGGGYSLKTMNLSAATAYNIFVGDGGIGGSGSATYFGDPMFPDCLAPGGSINAGGNAASGIGDVKYSGGDGAIAGIPDGGGGGASARPAGNGTSASSSAGAIAGTGGGDGGDGGGFGQSGLSGSFPGGGGGGAGEAGASGGIGAGGFIRITYDDGEEEEDDPADFAAAIAGAEDYDLPPGRGLLDVIAV